MQPGVEEETNSKNSDEWNNSKFDFNINEDEEVNNLMQN